MAEIWKSEVSSWKHRNHARRIFIDEANNHTGEFLEIGPGYGRVMRGLENIVSVIGLEMDSELVVLLRSRNLKAIQGIAEEMPFSDEAFDVILCEEVIEHIINQQKVVSEVYRVLKKGGIAIFSTPNKWVYRTIMFFNSIRRWKFLTPIYKNPTPGHVAEITGNQLKKLFEKQFEIELIPINAYLSKNTLKKFPFLSINNMVIGKKTLC